MTGWGLQRYLVLCAVLALHIGLIALLWMMPLAMPAPPAPVYSVELLQLAPQKLPKIRIDNLRPRRLSDANTITLSPPLLQSESAAVPASPSTGPRSGANGTGSDVDWTAEARRAVQAFEIRNHQPKNDQLLSGSPADERWWPYGKHHAGDHFKTPAGDWIVWINSSCYQVANSGPNPYVVGTAPPRTICVDESKQPQRNSPN
jgi:hypothetical protein